MTKFCHIAPIKYLSQGTRTNGAHLILAHLVEQSEEYTQFYANLNDGKPKIMDNSAFEMYKQDRSMYPSDKLIEMGNRVNADYIVMSDYPAEPGEKTIQAAEDLAPQFQHAGFKTMFVPQSRIGDITDFLQTFNYGLTNNKIDMVGVSILGVPNAFGVEKNNQLQRYLSRYHLMKMLKDRMWLQPFVDNDKKKLHFLGMTDGPNEIELVREFLPYIYSWDSSAAVWAGLNGILFDNSPTGLIRGKFEREVDFYFDGAASTDVDTMHENIRYLDKLIRQYS